MCNETLEDDPRKTFWSLCLEEGVRTSSKAGMLTMEVYHSVCF